MKFENVIIVTGKTRLDQLIERFNTKAQARFYIEHSGGNFEEYEEESNALSKSLTHVIAIANRHLKMKCIERNFLPNFLFGDKDIVVALGQDGLVANVAKYTKGLPLIGVNPDPQRNDGTLLPFTPATFEAGLASVFNEKYKSKQVTMAKAITNDGQKLLAFNDLFIGPNSHTSARYRLNFNGAQENQSSSGLIVSTGAGSTGWLSSVLNMSIGVSSTFGQSKQKLKFQMSWDDDRLAFVVREPFLSKHSQISLTAGIITKEHSLVIESQMPFNGVVFSDGIEEDHLRFNSGCQVRISIAEEKANIVLPL